VPEKVWVGALRRDQLRRQDGQALLLVMLTLPLLLAIAALVVDGANLFVQKRGVQNTADAVAHALARDLDGGGAGCTPAYSPAQNLNANMNATQTTVTSSGTAIQNGDYIQIENETMLVKTGGGTTNLTVARAQVGTTAALHNKTPTNPIYQNTCAADAVYYGTQNGDASLHACTSATDTTCYATPYQGNTALIQVRITRNPSSFFASAVYKFFGGGDSAFRVTAAAAATVANAGSPQYTFASLNSEASCNHHTLVVRLGGQLTVTNTVYVNSCSDDDGFDLFGPGGNLSAPEIRTHGGWETHDNDTVTIPIGSTTCQLGPKVVPPATAPHCPITGQPILADPFGNNVPRPSLGSLACTTPIYGAPVSYNPKQTVQDTGGINATQTNLTSSGTAIQDGDYIRIENETLHVTAGGGTTTLTVDRGQLGTTAAPHAKGKEIKRIPVTVGGSASAPFPCEVPSGSITLQPGTYYGGICIGADVGADCRGANCTPAPTWTFAEYNSRQTLSGAVTDSATTIKSSGTAISTDDVIKIDNEWMLVTDVAADGKTLTVVRGYDGTVAAAHANGAHILEGTATNVANVTLAPGTYVMAGGGFRVCGLSTLSAPNVLIYNTQAPLSHAFNTPGAIDQVMLNTSGSVSLGPQTSGLYKNLTIFQDPTLEVAKNRYNSNDTCDNKSAGADNPPSAGDVTEWDVGLVSMASTGVNGALGSVSGTIYAPSQRALFADSVSGTANLAVITGCIFIDGGNSTFDYQSSGLFGIGTELTE
jgi:hypothetical protein